MRYSVKALLMQVLYRSWPGRWRPHGRGHAGPNAHPQAVYPGPLEGRMARRAAAWWNASGADVASFSARALRRPTSSSPWTTRWAATSSASRKCHARPRAGRKETITLSPRTDYW